MRILGAMTLTLLFLGACTKPETTPAPGSSEPAKPAAPPVVKQLAGAATTPLHDLNLVRAKLPPVLLAAHRAPYAPPADPSCEALSAEIRLLDAALGDDLDVPHPKGRPSLVEQGKTLVDDSAVGAVRHAAEGLIPYRNWVRKLSGAERYSSLVTGAVGAGIVRRAYLKGLGQAKGCEVPAAPRPLQPARTDAPIDTPNNQR